MKGMILDMKFINDKHRKFYYEKCNELESRKVVDVYYRSVIYSLGICEETRNNFNKIIDIEKGEIKVNSLSEGWQTGTSAKVTRLAFSLWNNCNYDSEKDFEENNISKKYNVGEIFSCRYAPYFHEAIKIRYPEYTKEKNRNDDRSL